MSGVVKVDFKTGEKIEVYEIEEYLCEACRRVFKYDSRVDSGRPTLVYVRYKYYCRECVEKMYEAIGGKVWG